MRFPFRDLVGPLACAAAAVCLVGAMAVDLDSTAAKVMMVTSAVLFVPGAFLTLVFVRRYLGPPL